MARFLGDMSQTCLLFESGTYASTSGAANWIGMVQDCNIAEEINKIPVRYNAGASRNVQQWVDTVKKAKATFNYYPQDWRILAFTLGSCVDVSGSNSTHTISETNSDSSNAFTSGANAPFISFGLEDAKRFNPTGLNHIKTMIGGMVNELIIDLPRSDAIKVSVDAVGQAVNYGSGAASSITAATTLPYLSQHAVWSLPSGTAMNEVASSSIRISNGIIAEPWQNGSEVVTLPFPTDRNYSVELKMEGNTNWSKALYDQYYKGGSEFNLFLRVAPSATRFLEITFSGCEIPSMADPTTFTGAQEQTITITPKSCSAYVQDQVVKYNPW